MRRLMAAYARTIQPDPGFRARIAAHAESRPRPARTTRWAPLAAALIALLLVATFLLVHQPNNRGTATRPTFNTFTTPSKDSMPVAIVAGPDGAMWFTESS